MKININKKLLLTYLEIGVVSFILTGCSFKNNKDVIANITIENIIDDNNANIDTVDVIWHIPRGYELVNVNGEPKGARTIERTITNTIDVIYSVPSGYELVDRGGVKYGIKKLDDGTESVILASISLPNNAKDYVIRYINGIPKGVREIIVKFFEYTDVTYDLPEGYILAYINDEFVGVLADTYANVDEMAKILVKNK